MLVNKYLFKSWPLSFIFEKLNRCADATRFLSLTGTLTHIPVVAVVVCLMTSLNSWNHSLDRLVKLADQEQMAYYLNKKNVREKNFL